MSVLITISFDEMVEAPEIAEHQPVEFVCGAAPGVQLALALDGQALEPFLRPGESAWRWRWNPGSAVGVHRATLGGSWPDSSATERRFMLRVVPRKIDQERYELLLHDIQRVAHSLLYTLAGSSAEGAGLQREPPWQRNPIEDYYSLFEQRFEAFERAVRRIAARPREHLRGLRATTPLGQAASIGADAFARLPEGQFDQAPRGVADELQDALRPGGGLLPRDIPADQAAPTADIYEHRLLKQLLALLLRRARFIGALAERERARLDSGARRARVEQIAAGCTSAVERLQELRGLPFLAEVRPLPAFRGPTPLLQRDPAYREVYRMWQAQRQPPLLAFDSPLFFLPIADLPHVYETWCALVVARALLDLGGEVRQQQLISRPRAADDVLDFSLSLPEHAPLLTIDHSERRLTLRYQPRYRPWDPLESTCRHASLSIL